MRGGGGGQGAADCALPACQVRESNAAGAGDAARPHLPVAATRRRALANWVDTATMVLLPACRKKADRGAGRGFGLALRPPTAGSAFPASRACEASAPVCNPNSASRCQKSPHSVPVALQGSQQPPPNTRAPRPPHPQPGRHVGGRRARAPGRRAAATLPSRSGAPATLPRLPAAAAARGAAGPASRALQRAGRQGHPRGAHHGPAQRRGAGQPRQAAAGA